MSDYALKKMIGTMEQMLDQFNPKNSDVYKYAMKMVREDGLALESVPSRIVDRELCLVAVKQNWKALEFVPEEVKDKEVCLTAVKNTKAALPYVPEQLRDEISKLVEDEQKM